MDFWVVEVHVAEASEPSQRARAFLFLSIAGVTAIASDLDIIEVYENGVGAIGLHYLTIQEGAHTTKAMHPATLCRFASLLTSVAGRPMKYANPSLWLTKAELCRLLPDDQRDLIIASESCDTAFSYRGEGVHRCGSCTSCLLRRQALWAAGLEEIDARQDVRLDLALGGDGAKASERGPLLAMLDQAERLDAAIRSDHPWITLSRELPTLAEIASSPTEREACLRLYRSYVNEWRSFPSPLVDRYLQRMSPPSYAPEGACPHG